MGRNGRLDTVL